MKGSLVAALFALLFAVPFGGVGAFASWMIWTQASTHWKSESWVVAQATVQSAELAASRSKKSTSYAARGTYTYTIGGRQYTSERLGLDKSGGADNVGDWQEDMAAFLKEAQASGRTIPVYVNPEDPAEAVVDREIRWGMVGFMAIFAIAFGGVGVGAFVVFCMVLFAPLVARWKGIDPVEAGKAAASPQPAMALLAKAVPKHSGPIRADGVGGLVGLWFFAIVWNGISIPAALLALPQAWAGEWMLFLVLLFPLVGSLVLWAAIAQTFGRIRFGRGTLTLGKGPELGGVLEGFVEFPRGVKAGQAFDARLQAMRMTRSPGKSVSDEAWSLATTTHAVAGSQRPRIPVRFEVPPAAKFPAPTVPDMSVAYDWRLEVGGPGGARFTFTIPMAHAPVVAKPRFAGQELATSSALPF